MDPDGKFKMVNPAYCEMTGYSKEELIGAPATKVVSKEVAEKAAEKLDNQEDGESVKLEAEMKTADGSKLIGETNFAALKDKKGELIGKIGVVRDTTQQKRLEETLRGAQKDSEEIARSMIEAIEDYAIFRLDTEGNIVSWNEGAEQLKGYKEEEILGENFSIFYTDEDKKTGRPETNLEQAKKTGKARDRSWRLRKDGSRFWADVTINTIRDNEGELRGFTKVTKDMTEQQKRKQRMENQIEEFSSILGHDLKNPLEVARGYIDLAKESGNEKDLKKAEQALDRISRIIGDTQLITMDPEDLDKTELSLEEVFKHAYDMTEKARPEKDRYGVEDVDITGNLSSLTRLLGNLIRNSVEHNTGEIKIRAGSLENGFYYEDNGKGIPDDVKQEVMKHGFTTSENGQGLGLYIVKRISELHEWDVEVKDSEKGGARFEFRNKT